jgi:phage terminase small subunit
MVQTPRKHADPLARKYANVVPIPGKRGPKPAVPAHLEPEEQALWRDLYASHSLDDPASLVLLATVCEARGRVRRCRILIDAQGETVVDRFGVIKPHPLLSAESHAQATFLGAMRALRLDVG